MKNIIATIMIGIALLGSAEACNMQHRPHMNGHDGIHKQVKKHRMHRGHHRHGIVKHHAAAKPMMKRHFKPMTVGCISPCDAKNAQWLKPQMRQHRHGWGKMHGKHAQKLMMRRQFAQNAKTVCHVRKHTLTFGPKRQQKMHIDPLMSLPKHIQPSPEMMKKYCTAPNKKRRG